MEKDVMIKECSGYKERQYQKQDGSTDVFKSMGFVLKSGAEEFYGEMVGDAAERNKLTEFYNSCMYVVRGTWRHRTWQDSKGETRHENTFIITDLQTF